MMSSDNFKLGIEKTTHYVLQNWIMYEWLCEASILENWKKRNESAN